MDRFRAQSKQELRVRTKNEALTNIIRKHAPEIVVGFSLAIISSFGQTYFIALSVPGVQAAFGLSHGSFGWIFSVATLASGLMMIWIGGTFDRIPADRFAVFSLVGLGLAALTLSLAGNLLFLVLAVFGLRLFGQGTLSHAAITGVARLPIEIRGRAIGITTVGFAVGAMTFPLVGVPVIAGIGWIGLWQSSAVLIFCLAAIVYANGRNKDHKPADKFVAQASSPLLVRMDILHDRRFLWIIPLMLGPSAIGTGYYFHQLFIADEKAWSLEILAGGLSLAAFATAIGSFLTGILVDRIGAIRISRFHQLPLAAGAISLGILDGWTGAFVFFALLGITSGANSVIVTAVLAEIYGTLQIGMIRGLASAIMVVGSALTPGLFGFMMDGRIALLDLGLFCAAYLVFASLLALRIRR